MSGDQPAAADEDTSEPPDTGAARTARRIAEAMDDPAFRRRAENLQIMSKAVQAAAEAAHERRGKPLVVTRVRDPRPDLVFKATLDQAANLDSLVTLQRAEIERSIYDAAVAGERDKWSRKLSYAAIGIAVASIVVSVILGIVQIAVAVWAVSQP